uniref:Kinesin motor domain-containing protein n=1 Tax=Fagus sylvatica TaxID=28930 RepID=A0A2N9FES4_FAGSY
MRIAYSFPVPQVLNTVQLLIGNEYELVKKKYLKESSERKRLYNEVIELKGNIRVICSDSSKKQFKFDHVFRPEDNQGTLELVTHSVLLITYWKDQLIDLVDSGGVMRYELFVSMLEVYNEKIRDLLVDNSNQPAKKLEIKQAAEGTQEVPGLVEARVYGTDNVWELLKSGSRVRSVGSTNANELSSRSHCLLRVSVKGGNLINGQRTRNHLWLVDLAGSERVGRIEVEGERLKESQFINKSLSALGDELQAHTYAAELSRIAAEDLQTILIVQLQTLKELCILSFSMHMLTKAEIAGGDFRGIESGPARKQADLSELFKYKQMAEKLKHDEKETKKLQDNLQSMQLKLSAREHICRNLQEKVRDLENQLAEERKTRLKQETRAFAAASAQPSGLSSLKQAAPKSRTEKRPPLAPSKVRLPLRRISNFLPPPSPVPPKKAVTTHSLIPSSAGAKENIPKTTMAATKSKNLMIPRRFSVAIRPLPSTTTTTQAPQPRRRVSISTFHPESNSHMTTPLHNSASRFKHGSGIGRQSFVRDPRKARYSRLFSPLPELRTAVETTPTAMRSSSKFMGSPPTQAGSWKPKHPTVVALQRKPLVWSPLKLRGLKNYRRPSLLPSQPLTEMQ